LRILREKFEELEELLLHHRRQLAQSTGVPFVRLVYRPEEEQECQRKQQTLARTLRKKGLAVEIVSCRGAIFAYYEQSGRLEQLFALEAEGTAGLTQNIARHGAQVLKERILQAARLLAGEGIILLTDVAFVYPYLELEPILDACTNEIRAPMALVFFYPAEEDAAGDLRFLGQRPSSYYRARPLV